MLLYARDQAKYGLAELDATLLAKGVRLWPMGGDIPHTHLAPAGNRIDAAMGARARRVHAHAWIWEPLEEEPGFQLRSMFGTKAVYLEGKLLFCFADKREPWSGMLVATSREHHGALVAEIPALRPHPVLPKWLYLSAEADCFEAAARRLVRLAGRGDARLGVVPPPRKAGR